LSLGDTASWPCLYFGLGTQEAFAKAVRRLKETQVSAVITPLLDGGLELRFETVADKDKIAPPDFDRSKPQFRLYAIKDAPETNGWFEVLADNLPGRRATREEVAQIDHRINTAPWRDDFWYAIHKHGKATLYAPLSV